MPRRTARDLRHANRALVLRSLYFDGATSRVQLAARTHLSPATVGTVVSELLGSGVLAETGQLESDGGRPATTVAVRPQAAATIGVDVGETGLQAELFDLSLTRLEAGEVRHDLSGASPQDTAQAVRALIEPLLAHGARRRLPVLGIGVGVPGIVDERDETVIHVPSLGWSAVPFRALLNRPDAPPVMLDNGAKTLGRAEAWFGAGRGVDDLVVVLVGTGVGAAIITGGQVYRGRTSSAGEWGHITIQTVDGAPCRCGSAGCLEAYVGAPAIARRWRRASRTRTTDEVTAIRQLAQAADEGRASAAGVIEETADYLAAGVGTLANLLNPRRVVIGGWVGLALGEHLLPVVSRRLALHSLGAARDGLEIELSRFGPDAVALGAALLPVERFLAEGGRLPGHVPVPTTLPDLHDVS